MVEWIVGLAALTAMEIVLGIDNIVFITIVSARLPKNQQPLARRLGLGLALVSRLALLWLLFTIVHGEDGAAYLKNNVSNQGFHYHGSPKFFVRAGVAFAEALAEMQ